ncbi:hypothetical protein CPAST_c04050 [Clostridium pasteurianum DSM 525 = ATCC 6013]|uniref:Lipoprotein n=1 Tax=Clostridium pasteurianum DSM 525 = ATCC 6013 TaxID=1262449 RepID=A0A0H3J6D2_CLOPA|nr:hypothetical protein [Clostridium pasteurianum]AJA46505.1 hypothetical protein CPAST_c04050 [Clostridium pasteurianum DSM 525 = ATCC 6013]AJA50493.1 hypothetical protein CLPA_c04050 [Clostridium pasteurianum DSM 525 = ATCC 6013]AOZ73931.1 hypothetical protein AQ983_01960 [Clostridium pasteurianum DSM 525 = ATCC 6013]AOZ77728.1 hypothetical protein AQ984_01960 [Clostridium pasteurianum]ELP61078.1 hypothetical protein F502_01445 [Clostridium pasteurianum DSM 525 = ATCC 6013]
MKKFIVLILSMTMFMMLLSACGFKQNLSKSGEFKADEFIQMIKSDKIEIKSIDSSSVISTVTDQKYIDQFVKNLKIQQWQMTSLPDNSEVQYEYVLNNGKANIITFKDIPYVQLEIKGFNFTFKVPEDVANYLNAVKK